VSDPPVRMGGSFQTWASFRGASAGVVWGGLLFLPMIQLPVPEASFLS